VEPTKLGAKNVEGYKEFEAAAQEISRDQPGFDRNIQKQTKLALQLSERWKTLGEADRRLLLQKFALTFPRCREDGNPQESLRSILQLPPGKDTQRALRVRSHYYKDFKTDPGEELYPASGWLGRYLQHAKWNKVPLALHFWAGLSILGAATRRNYFFDNGVDCIWMNQFIILGGAKGNGKSAARGIAKTVLVRMNTKLAKMQEENKLTSASAWQIPIIPSDITPQELTKQLSLYSAKPRHVLPPGQGEIGGQPGEAIAIQMIDEFANAAGKAKHSAAMMIPLLTELCFNDEYHKATKIGGVEDIERMAFSILACTQPGWLRDTIVSNAKEGGFIERVNFIHRPESKRVHSFLDIPPVDPVQSEQLADQLLAMATRGGEPEPLEFTPEGKAYFNEWYFRIHKKGPLDAEDATKHSLDRRCIHLVRVAGLLAISEGDTLPKIQISHLIQATAIIEAEDRFMPVFMALASESPSASRAREVYAWMVKKDRSVTKREFGQHSRFRGWTMAERNEAIDTLIDMKLIQHIRDYKGGERYEVQSDKVLEEES